MKTNFFLILWACLLTTLGSFAQTGLVTITQLSMTDRAGWGSLGRVELTNHTATELEVHLIANLRQDNRLVKREQSVKMTLSTGPNSLDLSGLNLTAPNIVTSEAPQAVSRQLCLEVVDLKHELLATACEDMLDLPMTPPYLVYPFNQDKLTTQLPVFTWTPPMPIKAGQRVTYTVKIVEVNGGKNALSAMLQSQPYFVQEGIFQTVLPYPVSAPTLSYDQAYAWQVEVFVEGQPAGKTEIWNFMLSKPKEAPAAVVQRGFVELKRNKEPGLYYAKGDIRFRFDPRYGEPQPDFAIQDAKLKEIAISDNKIEKVKDNLFILHLPPGSGLKVNGFYTFEVKDAEGMSYYLPFKYMLEEN